MKATSKVIKGLSIFASFLIWWKWKAIWGGIQAIAIFGGINADVIPLLSTTNTIPIEQSIEKTKNLEKPNKEQLKKAIFEELKRLTKNKTHTPFDIKTLIGIEKVNKATPVTTLKHNEKGKYFSAPILINAIGIFKSYGLIDKRKAELGEIEYLEEFETIRQFKLKMNDYGDWWAEIDNINGLDV